MDQSISLCPNLRDIRASGIPRRSLTAAILAMVLLCGLARAQIQWVQTPSNPLLPGWYLEPSVYMDSAQGHITKFWVSNSYDVFPGNATTDTTLYLSGAPALVRGKPGEFDALAISSCEVVKKDSTYFMYYTATCRSDSSYIGLATSHDGLSWKKFEGNPVLRPGPPGSWDAQMVLYPRVIVEDGKFKMWYHMSPDGWYTNVGVAFSDDGYVWTKFDGNPVILHGYYSVHDYDGRGAGVGGVTKVDSIYYLMSVNVKMDGTSSIGLVTSADGLHWHKFSGNPVIASGMNYGWDGQILGGGALRYYGERFHFWYSGYGMGGWNVGYATSPKITLAVPPSRSNRPAELSLGQNYPNPFNPSTVIEYEVSTRQHVRLAIYSILGQEVAVLVDEMKQPGKYSVPWAPKGLASGAYWYTLNVGGISQAKKMIHLK